MLRLHRSESIHRCVAGLAIAVIFAATLQMSGAATPDAEPALRYVRRATWHETYAASLAASGIDVPVLGEWHLVGPFANPKDEGLKTEYPPETETNLDKLYEGVDGRLVRWQPVPATVDGQVNDLSPFFPRTRSGCIYLLRTLFVSEDVDLQVVLGSDESFGVWVNGLRVFSREERRAGVADQHRIELPLREGENELLVKLCQSNRPWEFYFALPAEIPPSVEVRLLDRLIRDFPAHPNVGSAYRRLYEARRQRWSDRPVQQMTLQGVNVQEFGASGIGDIQKATIDSGERMLANLGDPSNFRPGEGVCLWQFTPIDGMAVIETGEEDAALSVQVRPWPGDRPSEGGLAFRAYDAENAWALTAAWSDPSAPQATIRLFRIQEGNAEILREETTARPTSPTASLTLSVLLDGESIEARVNNRAVFELEHPYNDGVTKAGLYHRAGDRKASPFFDAFRVDARIEDRFDRPGNRYSLGETPSGPTWMSLAGRWGVIDGMAQRTEGAAGERLLTTVVAIDDNRLELADPWTGEDNALVEVYHDDTAAVERALAIINPGETGEAAHVLFPEGVYHLSRTIHLGPGVKLSGLAAGEGRGATLRALPGTAPEFDGEHFLLYWRFGNHTDAADNRDQGIDGLRIDSAHPATNPGLSGIRLATGPSSRYVDLSVDVPQRGIVVAEGSRQSGFDTIDVHAGTVCIDLRGRGVRTLDFRNLLLATNTRPQPAVGLRVGPGSQNLVVGGLECDGLPRPVVIEGGSDLSLLGLCAWGGDADFAVVDVLSPASSLNLSVSGTAEGFRRAVSIGDETVAWVKSPAVSAQAGAFRFVSGLADLWLSNGQGGPVNSIAAVQPGRKIEGGRYAIVDQTDVSLRGAGCATYEYIVTSDESPPTVEMGTLTLVHNGRDFQLARAVKGRVGPRANRSLFTPDAMLRGGLLSLRVHSDVPEENAVFFNAQKTALGLPGSIVPAAPAPLEAEIETPGPTRPAADGSIRDWLLLGPVPYLGDSPRGVLATEDIDNENRLRPEPGNADIVRGFSRTWRPAQSEEPILDLSRAFQPEPVEDLERSFGYAVVYLLADREIPNLTLRVDYDDAVKVWFNGEEIELRREAEEGDSEQSIAVPFDPAAGERPLAHHAFRPEIALKEGRNVLVLKTANETGQWAIGLRFRDLDGKPVTDYRVALDPDLKL